MVVTHRNQVQKTRIIRPRVATTAMARTSTTIRPATPLDFLLLIAIAIMWASAFVAIKIAVPEVGPLWLAAIRVFIGFLVLLPYVIWIGFHLPRSARQWRLVVVMSILNVVIPFFLISWAELTITAGVASLLMGTGPFLALIGSHLFTDDDRITGHKMIAVLLGFSGMAIVVGWDAIAQLGAQHTLAQLAALGGALCYVTAGLIIRRLELDAGSLAVLALAIGSAILLPTATVFDGLPAALPSDRTMAALLYLGVVPTGIAYVLRFYLIRTVGYTTFSLSVNMIPVFGVMLGFLVLGEALRPQVVIALLLVVAGLIVVRRGSKARTVQPAQETRRGQ